MKRILTGLAGMTLLILLVGPIRDEVGPLLNAAGTTKNSDDQSLPARTPVPARPLVSVPIPVTVAAAPPSGQTQTTALPEADEASVGREEGKKEIQAAIMEYRMRAPDRIKNVQRALKHAGFDPGPVDGHLGPRTKKALVGFQKAQGLEPDGIVGMKTWAALSRHMATAQSSVEPASNEIARD